MERKGSALALSPLYKAVKQKEWGCPGVEDRYELIGTYCCHHFPYLDCRTQDWVSYSPRSTAARLTTNIRVWGPDSTDLSLKVLQVKIVWNLPVDLFWLLHSTIWIMLQRVYIPPDALLAADRDYNYFKTPRNKSKVLLFQLWRAITNEVNVGWSSKGQISKALNV